MFKGKQRIESGMHKQPPVFNVVKGCLGQKRLVLIRYTLREGLYRCLPSLMVPYRLDGSLAHPLKGPPIMISEDIGELADAQQFVNSFARFRPTVGNISKANQPVILVMETRPLQALPQGAVGPVNVRTVFT